MKKVNKNDEFVRRAIWETYNHKCFYTNEPLEYKDMEIDHIIPKKFIKKQDDLKIIIEKCSLPNDFNLDSLYNLVPTNKFENRRKSDNELDQKTLMYYFSLTKINVQAIEKKIENLRKLRNFDKNISMVKASVSQENNGLKREILIEDIVNFVADESGNFEEIEQIYEYEKERVFKKYTKRIGLEATMPRYFDLETRCVIYFRTLKVRDCMIVIENKTILSELFSGVFDDPIHGTRQFIKFNNNKSNNKINLDDSIIHIGNNKLKLSSNDIYELCDVIDVYAKEYINEIKNIENLLKTHKFPLSKRRNNYKLISLSNDQWVKLINFTEIYDVDKGNSKWHIFDFNRYFIKVFTKKYHDRFGFGYHAFFHSEYDNDILLHTEFSSKDRVITWEFIEDLDNRGNEYINERYNWSAEIAYNWLVNELIPMIKNEKKRSKFFRKKTNMPLDYFINNPVEYINYLLENRVGSIDHLRKLVNQLQMYYHMNPNKKYRISGQGYKGLFHSILLCINNSIKIDIYYICNKLSLSNCNTKEKLISLLEITKENAESKTVTGFHVDNLFRALIAALEGKSINLTISDIKTIRDNIENFIIIHDRETLINKYTIDFE